MQNIATVHKSIKAKRNGSNESYVLANKNFLNYPLARDTRAEMKWWRTKKTKRLLCYISTQDGKNIRLYLPSDAKRHAPTAFDINVLFFLLAESKRWDSSEFILKSRSIILKRLGFCADHNNLRRLNESLAFWSVATLSFDFWFYPQKILTNGRIKHRRTGPQKLPPPFKVIDRGKELSVTINATWLELGPHFSQMTPLPLPRTAAAQNLVLCLLVSIKDNEPRRIRELCRKIGLNHRTRGYVLDNALECARTYYATHNGDLYWKKNGRTITFAITQPEKPTVKRASVKEDSAIELEPRKQEAPKRKPSSPKNRSRLELLPTQHKQTELQIEEVQDGWRDETGRAYQMYKLSDNRLVDADELIQLGLGDRV